MQASVKRIYLGMLFLGTQNILSQEKLGRFRRIIYTTNAIESVNMSLRKVTKNRGSFPSDEAVLKLFYLALMNISQKWTMPLQNWKAALNRFTIMFEERMPIR